MKFSLLGTSENSELLKEYEMTKVLAAAARPDQTGQRTDTVSSIAERIDWQFQTMTGNLVITNKHKISGKIGKLPQRVDMNPH